jgi:hypothetical protein
MKKKEKKERESGSDSIHVTMHIVSRRKREDHRRDFGLKGLAKCAESGLREVLQPIQNGEVLAKKLGLPHPVPVKWNIEVVALREGLKPLQNHIPVMVSVAGVPNLMERLKPELLEEITNILFKEIRNVETSREFAEELGYDTDKPAKFHVYLPNQVKLRGPARPQHAQGDGDGDGSPPPSGDYGPPVWLEGGWSKGCSSWPW